jgi:hypothetical protein
MSSRDCGQWPADGAVETRGVSGGASRSVDMIRVVVGGFERPQRGAVPPQPPCAARPMVAGVRDDKPAGLVDTPGWPCRRPSGQSPEAGR